MKPQTKFTTFFGLLLTFISIITGVAISPPDGLPSSATGLTATGITALTGGFGALVAIVGFLARNTRPILALMSLVGVKVTPDTVNTLATLIEKLNAMLAGIEDPVARQRMSETLMPQIIAAASSNPSALAEVGNVGALNLTGILGIIQTVATALNKNPELVTLLQEVLPLVLNFFKKPAK